MRKGCFLALYRKKTTGETLECSFSGASDQNPDRAVLEGLLACVREEYGDTYIDKRVYDLNWLMEETIAGRLLTAVAFTGSGEAAACICLRENPPFYGVGDLCMHVVRKAYRGYGVGTPLVAWIIDMPEARRFSAIGSHNATFHTMSQRESYACGLRPCGMLFNLYISQGFVHSHPNIGEKLSYAVAAMPLDKREVSLCVPAEYHVFAANYYRSVGVPVRFLPEEGPAPTSGMTVMEDRDHCTLTLRLEVCGVGLEEQVSALLARCEGQPMQTATACLELSSPTASWGCRVLTGLGFRFSGLQPFCRGKQYLLLHHPLGMEIPFDQMCIDPAYQAMFDDVRASFPNRRES